MMSKELEVLVMSSLESPTRLLSTSVSATAFLLPLVPILRPFCHLDFVTPYHTIPPISILSTIVPLSHLAPFVLLVRFL